MRYLRDFFDEWQHLGEAEFNILYGKPVLIGLGVVGQLVRQTVSRLRRTVLSQTDPETLVPTDSLVDRIWLIEKSETGYPGPEITVGRGGDNDLIIPELSVSNHHCHFRDHYGAISLFDAQSTNGTFVNGKRLEPLQEHHLGAHDRVILGRFLFEFLDGPAFTQRIHNRQAT